jgi:hypothetical protein
MERRRFIGGLASLASGAPIAGGASSFLPAMAAPDSFDVRDFGARGDGRTDDADAILATIAAARGAFVRFPPGQYALGRDIVVPDTVNLIGTPDVSVLLPTKKGGVALSISTPAENRPTSRPASIYGLTIDGSRTRGSTGMLVGANTLSGRIRVSHVEIREFHGPRAVGLRVQDCVDTSFEYSYFGRNTVNVHIEGESPHLPTLARFNVCAFREADTVGILLRRGHMTTFSQCLIESNMEEGVLITVDPRRVALRTSFKECWFENNQRGADQATRFHVVCDGTNGGAELRISAAYFSGLSRAIRLRNTSNFVLDDVLVQPVADTIVTEGTNCNGVITNMPLNIALRLERLWKNTAEHDMIVVGNTRGVPPSANRMALDGWTLPGVKNADQAVVLQDGVGRGERTMVRRGHVTRVVVSILESPATHPATLEVQRSADAGRTWQAISGATIQFVTTAGSHITDVVAGAGRYGEGDLVRLAYRQTDGTAAAIRGSAAIEVEVDSWSTAMPATSVSK